MPDEEMEITTDLAQSGFVEDIDIDLDFGQPDEDMELADFDQGPDMQHFNSDARDELMAEGDDESFGMIDADDITHNEAATAANDIEIDIGGFEDGSLDVTGYNGASHQVDEISYNEEIDAGDPNLESGDWFQASTEQVSGSAKTQAGSSETIAAVTVVDGDVTQDTTADTVEANLLDSAGVETIQNGGSVPVEDHVQSVSPLEDTQQALPEPHHEAELSGKSVEPSEDLLNEKQDEQHEEQNITSVSEGQPNGEAGVLESAQEAHQDDGPAGDETNSLVGAEPEEQQFVEDSSAKADVDALGNHLGDDEAYDEYAQENYENEENGGDQISKNPPDPQNEPNQNHSSAQDQVTNELQKPADAEKQQGVEDTGVEHPAAIALRHEMYISYGETDYRLFAKSEDDDPNLYFLKDTSALGLSLADFLTSLRDVVSEEVSPLDELVMHVDGLGLEFAESTTPSFLEKYTFGTIVNLYDHLVKNDEAETPPALYCYLMVRPNCNQRLMALLDSAETGRGLSEIAVYRETSPFDEAHESGADSPAITASPDHDAADDTFDYAEGDAEENSFEENDHPERGTGEDAGEYGFDDEDSRREHGDEETAELEDDFEPNSVGAADGAVLETANPAENPTETVDKLDVEPSDQKPEEDLLDFSEEELDLAPTKQDHPSQSPSQDRNTGLEGHDSDNEAGSGTAANHIPLSTSLNGTADAPNSDNTSATATLNGDDHDEIDYSDDEDADVDAKTDAKDEASHPENVHTSATLDVANDEEITWESENEEAEDENASPASNKGTVQVSPSHGKRAHSEVDDIDGSGEQSDAKRRRS